MNTRLRTLFILGTRPEAIKLAPLIHEFEKAGRFDVRVCLTGQHRDIVGQILKFFRIVPDCDLQVMRPRQSLYQLTARLFASLEAVLQNEKPDLLLVQGDTTTAFAASMAGFYARVALAHIEAGLRSGQKYIPFPEEMNRVLIARLADFHFAPTPRARENLAAEGIREHVWVVGNTGIDALFLTLRLLEQQGDIAYLYNKFPFTTSSRRILLVTAHRRENLGAPLEEICLALRDLAMMYSEIEIVFPVHPNPNVRERVFAILSNVPRVHLLPPLNYPDFVWLMAKSYLILTDSGGIQEEGPALGKPVLILRDITERVEAIEAGVAKLVGTRRERIVAHVARLLDDPQAYHHMAQKRSPYGQGDSALRIRHILEHIPSLWSSTRTTR